MHNNIQLFIFSCFNYTLCVTLFLVEYIREQLLSSHPEQTFVFSDNSEMPWRYDRGLMFADSLLRYAKMDGYLLLGIASLYACFLQLRTHIKDRLSF